MKPNLAVLPPAESPLRVYVRPGPIDHQVVGQVLAEGRDVSGVLFNPGLLHVQRDLLSETIRQEREAILDTFVMEQSLPGGAARATVKRIPWFKTGSSSRMHLVGPEGNQLVRSIVDVIEQNGFDAVLSPTHFLVEGISDPWFKTDRHLARSLRHELDRRGLQDVRIYYPLAVPASELRGAAAIDTVILKLRKVPIDAVWLRLHPFGTSNSGPIALAGYLRLCWQLRRLGIPIVGERTGTIGLALLAFDGVGGIEGGLTMGENFNVSGLMRRPSADSRAFAPQSRLYLPELAAYLSRKDADAFFRNKTMRALYGCNSPTCCPRGVDDMVAHPRRHFLIQRAEEVTDLSTVPSSERARVFMEKKIRPASDRMIRAASGSPALESHRRRLDSWRSTLGAILEKSPPQPYDLPALGQRIDRTLQRTFKPEVIG